MDGSQVTQTAAIHQPKTLLQRCWNCLEREAVFLMVLTLALYATRLTDLTIRGEESRRGRIAWEMVHSGDWLIPRVQGIPRLSRPPLQYWTIALVSEWLGEVNAVAVRLPSVLATLLTVLAIYGYGRCWMSRTGAFAAGAMYATFAQVLQLGRLGETEAVFTCLLSAALLAWHAGVLRNWSPWVYWPLAYALAAAATLAKGPQAPAYFVGGITVFLLITRDWRKLVTWPHGVAIMLACGLVGAWQIPFSLAMGRQQVSHVYLSEVAKRFEHTSISLVISHLTLFPFEVVIGCLFPWSLLLLAYTRRSSREKIQEAARPLLFQIVCILVAFPTVWIPPEARSRYFMPLFPCFAVLCGYVVEQLTASASLPATGWARWRSRPRLAVGLLACAIGGVYVGPIMSWQVAHSRDAASDVARVKQLFPKPSDLSSFGVVHHLFSYHYDDVINHHRWPATAADVANDVDFFCIDAVNSRHKPLPFAWVEIARVNCDRNLRPKPECEVIIGRRIPGKLAVPAVPAKSPAANQPSTQLGQRSNGVERR